QELIDRLLDWGRMESGHREYHRTSTDLRSIVQSATDAFEAMRIKQEILLDVALPPESTTVFADRGAMSDALLNLLTNAAKYGGSPCKIQVECAESAHAVYISVKDNGKGIPVTEHKRIFQKFYRIDDRFSREQEGSGLGLAIVKHVMRAHAGRVDIQSRPGTGSTFSLVLPRPEQGHRSHGGRKRLMNSAATEVLIVEDDESICLGLKVNLEADGVSVQTELDGEKGLRHATENPLHLIILDVMLPRENGFEVLRRLRESGNLTPVIMLSARGAEAEKVMGLELGAEDYITKPFGLAELLARVRAVLR